MVIPKVSQILASALIEGVALRLNQLIDPANQEASLYTELTGGSLAREDIYYLGEKDYSYSNFITIPEGKSLFLFAAVNSSFGRVRLTYTEQRELL